MDWLKPLNKSVFSVAQAVVVWQVEHGRHELPWQNTRDPYRVWLSEIMLQQTQVTTVLDYYARFLGELPDVGALANAPLDQVLRLWAGLGYYSRARHLHRCAQKVVALHGGAFPQTARQLQTLPGIGRSTAAAIASLCFGERVAILDGNVKRVLTRFLAFELDLARPANERLLWDLAAQLLPSESDKVEMATYTQGMMDLGASVCTLKNPSCGSCPLAAGCRAFARGALAQYPVKSKTIKRSAQSIWLLWAQTEHGAVWLSKRPTPGVWAGLYCFALFDSMQALCDALPPKLSLQCLPGFKHVLTHKDLTLHPVKAVLPISAVPTVPGAWFDPWQWPQLGLPAPVAKLLAG